MGRRSTGAITTRGAYRLELGFLLRKGFLQKGKAKSFTLTWSIRDRETGWMTCTSYWINNESYLMPRYTITDNRTGVKTNYSYKIKIVTIPSNLGRGEVPYLICPESGKRCRILYMAYNYPKFKARKAYQNRIYYESQLSSKYNYANTRYWEIDEQMKTLQTQGRINSIYKGKMTRRMARLKRLEEMYCYWDRMRWSLESMPLGLRKELKWDQLQRVFYL